MEEPVQFVGLHEVRHNHRRRRRAPPIEASRDHQPGLCNDVTGVVACGDGAFLLKPKPERGAIVGKAPYAEGRPRCPRRHLFLRPSERSALAIGLTLVGVKDRVLDANFPTIKIENNVQTPLDRTECGLRITNVRKRSCRTKRRDAEQPKAQRRCPA